MQSEPTNGKPFKSRFGAGYVAAAQFLAENMVDRLARRDNVQLPKKFWDTARWKRSFMSQVLQANSLLKTYDVQAIIRALRTPEGKRIYSFSAPWLDDLIKAEQVKFDREKEALKSAPPPPVNDAIKPPEPQRPTFVQKPSLLDKLRQEECK